MSTKTNPFVMAVDEIRRHKKITIQQLTEHIISTRTYHRYLNAKTDVTMSTLNALVERLHVDIVDILFYMMYVKTNEINYNEFITMVLKKEYQKTDELYHQIYQTQDQLMWEQYLLLDAYYLKYQVETKKVDTQSYHDFLNQHIEKVLVRPDLNIYRLTFINLYLQAGLRQVCVTLDKLLVYLQDDFYTRQRLIMYFMTTNEVLTYAMKARFPDLEGFMALVDKVSKNAKLYHSFYMMTNCHLFYAFIDYQRGYIDQFEQHLFRYLNGRNLVRGQLDISNDKMLVKQLFDIAIEDFLITYHLRIKP